MSSESKFKYMLSGLGRATLRGVKKCPSCGTYNGTRGLSCKNKKCNVVFKEKKKCNSEACKLVTGNSAQIYSVRVRDKSPDYRGFVRLPQLQTQTDIQDTGSFRWGSETALCFIDSCQRLFDTSILKCHETEQCLLTSMCQHIEAAMKSENEASTLTLRNSILSSLNINNNLKQDIYLLASQTSGPLVQRVSKNVMAVKCLVNSKHPLGYLHLTFSFSKNKEKTEDKYYCSCSEYDGSNFSSDDNVSNKKCVHFYACLCAFASDPRLTEEFVCFLNSELFSFQTISKSNSLPSSLDNQLGLILESDPSEYCNIEIEVLNEQGLLGAPSLPMSDVIHPHSVQVQNLQVNPNGEVTIIGINEDAVHYSELNETIENITEPIDSNSSFEIIPKKKCPVRKSKRKIKSSIVKELAPKSNVLKQKKCLLQKSDSMVEEKRTYMSFIQWLASVTERINQTMHYQFNGKPEALIFHIPQVFFDCLRERISNGGPKKRLPNYINAFVRKDALPLGTFTKYTWHITNILHVKQIFETPLIPLEITKSFIHSRDGTYEHYTLKDEETADFKNDNLVPIKPSKLKTYLKVGNTLYNQVEPTPFIIEWIPDILPISKIGELRIKFEYGHQQGFCYSKVEKQLKKNNN